MKKAKPTRLELMLEQYDGSFCSGTDQLIIIIRKQAEALKAIEHLDACWSCEELGPCRKKEERIKCVTAIAEDALKFCETVAKDMLNELRDS